MPGHSPTNFRDQAFGSLIKEYHITERIGSGTYGQVFRAHRWNQSKSVAIKVYCPGRRGSVSSATKYEVNVRRNSSLVELFLMCPQILRHLKKSLQSKPQYNNLFVEILYVPLCWQTATHTVFEYYPMDLWVSIVSDLGVAPSDRHVARPRHSLDPM